MHFEQLAAIIVAALVTGSVATTMITHVWGWRRRAQRPDAEARRLERLEQAIDAIAIEVERISEGQRFTTRLLAERLEAPPAPRVPERVITPH